MPPQSGRLFGKSKSLAAEGSEVTACENKAAEQGQALLGLSQIAPTGLP